MMANPSPDGDAPRTMRFGRLGFAAALGSSWLCSAVPSLAQTQAETGQPSPADGEAVPVTDQAEVVVTARYGEALVKPETELDEEQIGAYGTGSIGELVRRITPLTGNTDDAPVILINGERVDATAAGVNGYPAEALQRLAILPPEAAARYGYPGNKRVVNLVLKKHFVSWEAQAGAKLPTAGGRYGGNGSVGRFVIDGATRWNAQVQMSGESALRRSARFAPARFAPNSAGGVENPDDYLSLLPASRQVSVDAGVARPIGRFAGSFTVNAGMSGSRQGLGLALATGRPLGGAQHARTLGAGMTLSGRIAGWRASLNANYQRDWSDGRIDRSGAAPADDTDMVLPILASRNRARGESFTARLNLNKPIVSLPAGPVTSNLSIGLNQNRTISWYDDGSGVAASKTAFARQRYDWRLSLGIPVSSGAGAFSALGDLSLDVAASASLAAREPSRPRIDLGMNWTPRPALQISGTASFAKLAPSIEQLNAPYMTEVRRVYDVVKQEIAEPVWITGGNPDLGSGTRRTYSAKIMVRPLGSRLLTLSTQYRKQIAEGGAGGFPGLSPAIESAFPKRIVRDSAGRLISVDARAIRIARDLTERLDSGLALSLSGTEPKPSFAQGWQMVLTLNHGWRLKSLLQTQPGIAALDRLNGASAQSRHSAGAQLVIGRRGVGATLDGSWQSGYRLRDTGTPDGQRDVNYHPVTRFNLRLFAEPEHLLREPAKWLSKFTLSVDLQNLFNSYPRATLPDGSVPPGYKRFEVDPLGRVIQLTVRQRF